MSKIPRWGTPSGTRFNNADNIERYLQEDGHRTWGLVIYRCTYDSDDNWKKFIELLRNSIKKMLESYNGLDLMDSLNLMIIEDQSTLDDASTSFVREHFKKWAATAPEQEQGEGIVPGDSQRYRYCVQVDDAALEAIFDYENKKYSNLGHVNLIQKDWVPELNPHDPPEESIEDCTLHDVGWMMVDYRSVMMDEYCHLRDVNAWYGEYKRPPEVARG